MAEHSATVTQVTATLPGKSSVKCRFMKIAISYLKNTSKTTHLSRYSRNGKIIPRLTHE